MVADKNVFILGAGFSNPDNAPLMTDFIPEARKLHNSGQLNLPNESAIFKDVIDYIGKSLAPKCAQMDFNINSIEEVASHLLLLTETNPAMKNVYDNLIYVILRTIEILTFIPGHNKAPLDDRPIVNVGGSNSRHDEHFRKYCEDIGRQTSAGGKGKYWIYDAFAAAIAAIGHLKKPVNMDTIISFNYDLLLDYAIRRINLIPKYYADYALPSSFTDDRGVDKNIDIPIKVLKLHGSANGGVSKVVEIGRKAYPPDVKL